MDYIYIAKIKFEFEDNECYQFYEVNDLELSILKFLNKKIEGQCCGTSKCFACKVGGYKMKYKSYKLIEYNIHDMRDFFCGKPRSGGKSFCDLNYLLDIARPTYVDAVYRIMLNDDNDELRSGTTDFFIEVSKLDIEQINNIFDSVSVVGELLCKNMKIYGYGSLLGLLKLMRQNFSKTLFNELIGHDHKYGHNSMISTFYEKSNLKRTLRFIKLYYGNDLLYLNDCDILCNINKDKVDFLHSYVEDHPNIILKRTGKKIRFKKI